MRRKKRSLEHNAYLNTKKRWARPVRRFYYILKGSGLSRTTPNRIRNDSFVVEKPFRCRRTGHEMIFDFAIYSKEKNLFVELDDPGHEKPDRQRIDRLKDAAAHRVGYDVLHFAYEDVERMTDDQILHELELALS